MRPLLPASECRVAEGAVFLATQIRVAPDRVPAVTILPFVLLEVTTHVGVVWGGVFWLGRGNIAVAVTQEMRG